VDGPTLADIASQRECGSLPVGVGALSYVNTSLAFTQDVETTPLAAAVVATVRRNAGRCPHFSGAGWPRDADGRRADPLFHPEPAAVLVLQKRIDDRALTALVARTRPGAGRRRRGVPRRECRSEDLVLAAHRWSGTRRRSERWADWAWVRATSAVSACRRYAFAAPSTPAGSGGIAVGSPAISITWPPAPESADTGRRSAGRWPPPRRQGGGLDILVRQGGNHVGHAADAEPVGSHHSSLRAMSPASASRVHEGRHQQGFEPALLVSNASDSVCADQASCSRRCASAARRRASTVDPLLVVWSSRDRRSTAMTNKTGAAPARVRDDALLAQTRPLYHGIELMQITTPFTRNIKYHRHAVSPVRPVDEAQHRGGVTATRLRGLHASRRRRAARWRGAGPKPNPVNV